MHLNRMPFPGCFDVNIKLQCKKSINLNTFYSLTTAVSSASAA